MNEYRLPDNSSFPKEDIVLCKIYRKPTSLKVLEERAAIEEKSRMSHQTPSFLRSQNSSDHPQESFVALTVSQQDIVFKTEEEEEVHEIKNVSSSSSLGFGSMKEYLTELEVPKFSMDHLTMDPLWSQLKSPCLGNWSPYYANVLNF